MSNILISLAAEFVGKKAFSDADKATTSLEKNVKKLGKTLGISLSTAAVVAYGRASVKAFAADEAAAQRLTTAVNNLGLSFANVQVSTFISDLEKSASVADDQLRPAFQALLTTTGSLTQSQKLLNLAIETSRGTGVELTTVAKDLGMAFVGNTRGLRKYNLGLTQAELKTATFADVQARLNAQFTGANAAYLDTTAGKLTAIGLASDRLSESIGGALVDAFVTISGSNGVGQLVSKIDSLAAKIAKFGDGLELFAYKVKVAFSFEGLLKGQDFIDERLQSYRSMMQLRGVPGVTPGNNAVTGYARDDAARKKAEADAAKRAKELAKLSTTQVKSQKALTAEQKKQATLKKAGSIFDLEQIQLIAALKGQLSDEDRKRVELQFALLIGNTKEAQLLTYEIAKAQGLGEKLAKDLASLPAASNPFAAWDGYLDGLLAKARQVASLGMGSTGGGAGAGGGSGSGGTGVINIPVSNASTVESPIRGMDTGAIAQMLQGGYRVTDRDGMNQQIIVQIDGKAIASAVQNQSLSGNDPLVNRLLGGFK
jgi:hypothetical protein